MYSFLGDTLVEFLLPCYWICISIRYPVSKISVLHWNHTFGPLFIKSRNCFPFLLSFVYRRECVSTPSCWYDPRYHQTCLECLLFFEPWIPSLDCVDKDQDVPQYVFAATGPLFISI
jgi:hypothetical protein